jgi:hypothetical protein
MKFQFFYRNKAILVLILFLSCFKNLSISEDEIKLFQYFLLTYPDLIVQKQSEKINEGQVIKFFVKLKSEPNSKVSVPISTNSNLIQLNLSQMTFDSNNWDSFQELQIFAPEDDFYEDNQNIPIQFGPYSSADVLYNGKGFTTPIFYINNETKGINFSITNPAEGGPNGNLVLSLQSKPKGNVTININNPSPADLSFSSSMITFTPANWNTPQSVTITAIDDTLLEYTETFDIVLTLTSSDPKYNNLSYNIPVSIDDNDVPGFKLNVSWFNIQEGNTSNVNIRLKTAPTNNVNVSISASPASLCTISSGSSLTFTTANYNVDQTFTISAKPLDNIDNITESPTNCTITITGSSTDPLYNGLSQTLKGRIYDYLNAGIILNNGGSIALGTLLESGTTASFTIRLNSEPTNNVIVCFKSNNYCEAGVETTGLNPPDGTCTPIAGVDTPYFVFNNANWIFNKTITIKGRHDWDYRSGGLPTENGTPCNPPYPDGTKSFLIQIYTYCPTCNVNEQPYYHTNTSPYSQTPSGNLQDDLDFYTFVTSSHNGDFLNDATLTGANAIAKADNFCSLQNPGLPGTFKALLVDGTNRSACGNGLDFPTCTGKTNWVLKANKYYFRNVDDKLLFKTDINSFFVFGDPDAFGIPSVVWTGIGTSNWADDNLNNCSGWSSTLLTGRKGSANVNGYSAISNTLPDTCNILNSILCIQQ